MNSPVVLIAGSGGALGPALAGAFSAAGYVVAGIQRSRPAVADVHLSHLEVCDLVDDAACMSAVQIIVNQLGEIDVLAFNAAHLAKAPFESLSQQDFMDCWRVGVGAAVSCVRAVIPAMVKRGRGTILLSGATASLRGGTNFAAFASAKFALRGLGQSLAREYQPKGIHVAHVVLDGLLRGGASAQRMGIPAPDTMNVDDVARAYVWLAAQPTSAWTQELDLRTSQERF